MVSIKNVAKDAGVSAAAVSYVLNGKKQLSKETEEKILKSVEKLGYRSNLNARSLRLGKSFRLGIVVQNIRTPFFHGIFAGMEEAARAGDYSLTFLNSGHDIASERENVLTLRRMGVAGVIIDSCVSENEKDAYANFLVSLQKEGDGKFPVMLLEREISHPEIGTIGIDNFEAAFAATEHLVSAGRRHIAHITAQLSWDTLSRRENGYRAAAKKHGCGECVIYCGGYTARDGYKAASELIDSGTAFNGIFAANDQIALGCLRALTDAGISVPDDVYLIGFDNIYLTTITTPQLSTIDVQRYKMGYLAVESLIGSIENMEDPKKTAIKHILETKLIIRGSTRPGAEVEWDFGEV